MEWQNVLMAVLTGVVASFIYFGLMLLIRPHIGLSRYICFRENKSGEKRYSVKVVNRSWAKLVDVKYTMEYIKNSSDSICEIQVVEPKKTPLQVLDRKRVLFDFFKKVYDNSVNISYDLDESKYPVESGKTRLSFTIVARHSISGTMACKTMVFEQDSIKKDAIHCRGNSLDFQKII